MKCCLWECSDLQQPAETAVRPHAAAASTVVRQQTVSEAKPGLLVTPQHQAESLSHTSRSPPPPAPLRKVRQPRWETGYHYQLSVRGGWLPHKLAGGGSHQASHPARLLWISWPELGGVSRPRLCKTQTDVLAENMRNTRRLCSIVLANIPRNSQPYTTSHQAGDCLQ